MADKTPVQPTAGRHRRWTVFKTLDVDVHVRAEIGRGGEPRAPSQAGGAFIPAEADLVPACAIGGLPRTAGIIGPLGRCIARRAKAAHAE